MGLLVDGKWQDRWYDTADTGGRFVRTESPVPQLGHRRTAAPGPTGEGGFAAEPGRYHLYVSLACPWAHRTLIFRQLKGLERRDRRLGRALADGRARLDLRRRARAPPATGCTAADYLHQVYTPAQARLHRPRDGAGAVGQAAAARSSTTSRPRSSGCSTRPSTACGAAPGDYYPAACGPRSTAINARVYATVNNGVYRAGFATTQEAYDEAVDRAVREPRLARGPAVTPALPRRRPRSPRPTGGCSRRWCASTRSIIGHFKCNLRRLVDYPHLWAYTRELYQRPGVAETVDFDAHQAPLLRQPWHHQPDRHRAGGPGHRLRRAGDAGPRRGVMQRHLCRGLLPRRQGCYPRGRCWTGREGPMQVAILGGDGSVGRPAVAA